MEGAPPPPGQTLPNPDVEMGSADPSGLRSRPTYEELLVENKILRISTERLMQSLGEKDVDLKKKTRALRKVKRIFKADWVARIDKYKRHLKELPQLLKEEEQLQVTVEGLNKTMALVSQAVREKEEQARKLSKKVARLNERSQGQEGTVNGKRGVKVNVGNGIKVAVEIFPEEIWMMILGKVLDPKDLWNCSNTCQLFETLLRPWKTGWMLEQALPHLYRHLPGSKLLECRLVSRGWYAGVNSFLDNHPSNRPHSAESDPRLLNFVYPVKEKEIGNRNIFTFTPEEDTAITRLEELFPKGRGRNPFIGRSVNFFLRNPTNFRELSPAVEEKRWAKLYSFLEGYGSHIWNLAICFPYDCSLPTQAKVKELLTTRLFQLAPNLRQLCITETGCDDFINHGDLAPAPNLELLHVDLIDDDELVYAQLRKYRFQLRAIQVTNPTWTRVSHLGWPELKDLLLYFGDGDIVMGELNFDNLVRARMPLLSKLALYFLHVQDLSFPSLLAAIQALVTTTSLNTLQLAGPLQGIVLRDLDTDLRAPQELKTLELIDPWDEDSSSLPSHNFLRYFPHLENLIMFIRKPHSPSSREVKYETDIDLMPEEECKRRAAGLERKDEFVEINKYAYTGQLYKSNVWELLPRLKVLTIQWEVYTRSGYEAYVRNHPRAKEVEVEIGSCN